MFRSDVIHRADPLAGVGQLRALSAARFLGEAEVGQIDVPAGVCVGEKDIAGLDVAMDEPVGVCRVERCPELRGDISRLVRVERAIPGQDGPEIRAAHIPHREVQQVADAARLEDRHHVRMVQRGRQTRFALETSSEVWVVRKLGRNDLEGDLASEIDLLGQIDDPHTATAELTPDPKAAKNRSVLYETRQTVSVRAAAWVRHRDRSPRPGTGGRC